MKELTYLLNALMWFTLMLIMGILVMIYGWGLEPKSWPWIIGGGIFGRTAVGIMELMNERLKKDD